MRTFRELQLEVLRYFDVSDEPSGSADVELVKQAINQANQYRATEDNWQFMLSEPYTLSVVAGQTDYILPHTNIRKLQYLYSTTRQRFAESLPVRQAPFEATFENSSDPTYNFELIQPGSMVAAQPSVADKVEVASTATEASGVGLYLEGYDVDGVWVTETVDADTTSTYEYEKIHYYAKVGTWTGTMTVTTVGGEELLTLSASETGKEFAVVRFFDAPTEAETFSYRFFKQPRTLTRDNDRPDVPYPLSNLLVYDALMDLATYNELDSESVNIWRDKQQRWETNLYQLKLDADTVGGAAWLVNQGRRY